MIKLTTDIEQYDLGGTTVNKLTDEPFHWKSKAIFLITENSFSDTADAGKPFWLTNNKIYMDTGTPRDKGRHSDFVHSYDQQTDKLY